MPRPRTVSDETILDAVLALAHRVGPGGVTFAAQGATFTASQFAPENT